LQNFGFDETPLATDLNLTTLNDPAGIKLYLLELPWSIDAFMRGFQAASALSPVVRPLFGEP